MKVFSICICASILFACTSKNILPEYKEFRNYPNENRVNHNGSVFQYYFIKNAPKDNDELRLYTDKVVKELMVYKFNDTLKRVSFFFFTDRESVFWGVDESYHSNRSGVEDYNNPRRAEYSCYLDKKNKIRLITTIYKNERASIPSIIYSKSKIIKDEK